MRYFKLETTLLLWKLECITSFSSQVCYLISIFTFWTCHVFAIPYVFIVMYLSARECINRANVSPASSQTDGLRWCGTSLQHPVHPPSAGQPRVLRPRAGAGWARGSGVWPLESRRAGVCDAQRCVSFPGWECRGDLPQHLPPRLQLPGGLLLQRESGGAGLSMRPTPRRAMQTSLCAGLPARAAMAAAQRSLWSSSPRHFQTHLFYRAEETSERPAARGQFPSIPA